MRRALALTNSRKSHKWAIPISVEAPPGTTAMALEVELPRGWAVIDVSDGGRWDEAHNKVKWGPYFDALSRTVTFEARRMVPPRSVRFTRLVPIGRSTDLTGTVSFDGVNQPISIR
jgi:hypothetical protein